MTLRNLDAAFSPRSVAIVGASERPGSVGQVVLANVLSGGFAGAVYPVNPKYRDVAGRRCYARLADLPEAPDLAIIATPPTTVPGLIADLGARGGKAAAVITAGITNADGLRQRMLDAARPHLLRIFGPNTIGLLIPTVSLNASFVHLSPKAGKLGLISQSGAIVSSLVDWAVSEGIGFSHILSLGDMADVDVGDCINMLAADPKTSAILLYLESIPAPRKFMSAARAAARIKPVIAVKPGRHAAAAKAAQTHTGALAGADRVIDAALQRAGVIRVNDLEDLFNAAEITARFNPLRSARTGIVTNGGGAGVLAVDHLLDQGCRLAELQPATLAALDAALPRTWSHANPVDIVGDAPPQRYAAAVSAVASDPGVDALLVMNCPTALASPRDAAAAVAGLSRDGLINGKPVLACWLGKHDAEPARALLQDAGIASFDTPVRAAAAVALLTRWSEVQEALQRVPSAEPDVAVSRAAAAALIAEVAKDGRTLLTEPEAKALLTAYGVPAPRTLVAGDEDEVALHARTLLVESRSLVVKLLSRTITHKSDIGGVVLDLRSADTAREAAAGIRARVVAAGGAIDGFTVQPMIKRPDAHELIAGLSTDPVFGPTVLFGAGGTSVEVVDDIATGLVPLDEVLAADLIDRTRIVRLIAGYRDRPAANRQAIVQVLRALSQLAIDIPAILAIDINPVLADADGVIALDARVEIDPAKLSLPVPNPALAIRPYPAHAARHETVDGLELLVRPIRPEDAGLYPAFLERTRPEDLRLRFLAPVSTLSREMLVRLTQLDYDRDMAFVALQRGSGALCGIVRYSSDPDRTRTEFGILVRSDLKRRGLGSMLMHTLIGYARSEGIGCLDGLILRENAPMIAFCTGLGFSFEAINGEPSVMRAVLPLKQ